MISCQKKEKKIVNKLRTKYTNDGGSKCDKKKAHEADSCKNCTYGRVRKGLNDWCCRKERKLYTDNHISKNQVKIMVKYL